MLAAICATCASEWVRAFRAYGMSLSMGQESICNLGVSEAIYKILWVEVQLDLWPGANVLSQHCRNLFHFASRPPRRRRHLAPAQSQCLYISKLKLEKLQTYRAMFLVGRPRRGGRRPARSAAAFMSLERVVQSRLYSGRLDIFSGLSPLMTRNAQHSYALRRSLGCRRFPRSSAPMLYRNVPVLLPVRRECSV
jgi:hypothetical protein